MKKLLRILPVFLSLCGMFSPQLSIAASTPRSVDARTLDVAGVKTGMGLNEARAALATFLHVPQSDINNVMESENPLTHTILPQWIAYKKDGTKIRVVFETRIPIDKTNPLTVSQIFYEIPWTQQNEDAMKKSAIEKYGEPSNAQELSKKNERYPVWCADYRSSGGGCSLAKAKLSVGMDVTGTAQLHLIDLALTDARVNYQNSLQSRKPSF